MHVIAQPGVRERFWEELSAAEHAALLLDYDGTLAPFRVKRDQATPYEGIHQRLRAIMKGRTRVVVISGRSVREVAELWGSEPRPEMWGTHGFERLWTDGRYESSELDEFCREQLERADEALTFEGLDPRLERKPASLVVHWRGLDPEVQREVRGCALRQWAPFVTRTGLKVHEFDGGLELRPRSFDKGRAVRTLLEESPPQTVVAYLGDDLTDEDAFKTVHGRGLAVLVRPEYRTTAADLWLRPPEELMAFLERWASATGGEHEREP